MKYWLSGVFALCVATGAAAQNYQLVYSPTLKLEIWLDNVKDKNPASWCAREVPLRIVSRESKDPQVLNAFLPRVGSLMSSQCGTLRDLPWQLTDREGQPLAQGHAQKASDWAVEITPPAVTAAEPEATPAAPVAAQPRPEELSPAADTTPWSQFSMMSGCHFRTWWDERAHTSALFVQGKSDVGCGGDGWLSGKSAITRLANGASKTTQVTFLSGFPIVGLKSSDSALSINTVNNERMVLSNDTSPQSWLILPWMPENSSWDANGIIAVQISQQEASDQDQLKARLNEVRSSWGNYLGNNKMTIKLVEKLYPQLQDPAAAAYSTLK